MAILKEIESKAKYIKSVVDYVKKDAKTADGYYVDGINCDPNKATAEFLKVQKLWDKTDGRRYFHYVMSWDAKDNITPEQALDIVNEWIDKTPKMKGYQILLAAHIDQKHGNIHVHIVGNAVNMETGIKLHRNAAELAAWKQKCNEINLEHGFQPPKRKTREEKRKNPTTWKKEEYQALERAHKKQKKGLKEIIMESVVDACSKATSRMEFISHLAAHGIETVWKDTKKNITFTATDRIDADTNKRTVRDSNLQKTFGIECNKETLEAKFQANLKQLQSNENTNLHERRVSEQQNSPMDSYQAKFFKDHGWEVKPEMTWKQANEAMLTTAYMEGLISRQNHKFMQDHDNVISPELKEKLFKHDMTEAERADVRKEVIEACNTARKEERLAKIESVSITDNSVYGSARNFANDYMTEHRGSLKGVEDAMVKAYADGNITFPDERMVAEKSNIPSLAVGHVMATVLPDCVGDYSKSVERFSDMYEAAVNARAEAFDPWKNYNAQLEHKNQEKQNTNSNNMKRSIER